MSANQVLDTLRRVGWRGALPDLAAGQSVVRVAERHRAGYRVDDGNGPRPAQPAGHFLKPGLDPAERPAVGDFVVLSEAGEIRSVLPRRSVLMRAAAGERYERQVLASNIDWVLVVVGLDKDFNPRRVERYLALVEGSGARPVVVATKLDRHPDRLADLQQLGERIGDGVPLLGINAKDAASASQLARYLGPGDSAVLVGSSGAGKSTLTNTLLGESRMATGSVRSRDQRGRHTTTHRALICLPTGGCLIDTPGMRELALTGTEELGLFADIEQLALTCRFADCGHEGEPDCAITAAIARDELDAERLASYRKLEAQREEQAAVLAARMQNDGSGRRRKALGRSQRESPERR